MGVVLGHGSRHNPAHMPAERQPGLARVPVFAPGAEFVSALGRESNPGSQEAWATHMGGRFVSAFTT